jgi:hypothetical protein
MTGPLSDRLRAAAKDAVGKNCTAEWDVEDGLVVEGYEKDLAEGVATAVLRTLAELDRTVKGGDAFLAEDFDQLADEIEQE